MKNSGSTQAEIAVIILAAGASRRMGRAKQLIRIKGETLLARSLRLAGSVSQNIVLVLGAREGMIRRNIKEESIFVVFNPDWESGMGSSLRAGLKEALDRFPEMPAALFMVVDQPMLTESLLRNLLRAHNHEKAVIAASYYGGHFGVPALFDRSFFPELLSLDGDKGARELLKTHAAKVFPVNFEQGIIDLDTPGDLERFRKL